MLFARTSDLVQKLQVARRELALEAALASLERFDLLILDDITYVTKDQAETSVLFELNVESYRRRAALERKQHGAGRPAAYATPKNVGVPAPRDNPPEMQPLPASISTGMLNQSRSPISTLIVAHSHPDRRATDKTDASVILDHSQ